MTKKEKDLSKLIDRAIETSWVDFKRKMNVNPDEKPITKHMYFRALRNITPELINHESLKNIAIHDLFLNKKESEDLFIFIQKELQTIRMTQDQSDYITQSFLGLHLVKAAIKETTPKVSKEFIASIKNNNIEFSVIYLLRNLSFSHRKDIKYSKNLAIRSNETEYSSYFLKNGFTVGKWAGCTVLINTLSTSYQEFFRKNNTSSTIKIDIFCNLLSIFTNRLIALEGIASHPYPNMFHLEKMEDIIEWKDIDTKNTEIFYCGNPEKITEYMHHTKNSPAYIGYEYPIEPLEHLVDLYNEYISMEDSYKNILFMAIEGLIKSYKSPDNWDKIKQCAEALEILYGQGQKNGYAKLTFKIMFHLTSVSDKNWYISYFYTHDQMSMIIDHLFRTPIKIENGKTIRNICQHPSKHINKYFFEKSNRLIPIRKTKIKELYGNTTDADYILISSARVSQYIKRLQEITAFAIIEFIKTPFTNNHFKTEKYNKFKADYEKEYPLNNTAAKSKKTDR